MEEEIKKILSNNINSVNSFLDDKGFNRFNKTVNEINELKQCSIKKFELKENLEDMGSSDGFWYDLTKGGYFEPEDVILDEKQLQQVKNAIKLLQKLEDVYDEIVEEFQTATFIKYKFKIKVCIINMSIQNLKKKL